MLKPFFNKKKNIDDRLVPEVSVEDAGKALVVGEDGKITTGEVGGGTEVVANPSPAGSTLLKGLAVEGNKYVTFSDYNAGAIGQMLVYVGSHTGAWQYCNVAIEFEYSYVGVTRVWNSFYSWDDFTTRVDGSLVYNNAVITLDDPTQSTLRARLAFAYKDGSNYYFTGLSNTTGTPQMLVARVYKGADANETVCAEVTSYNLTVAS